MTVDVINQQRAIKMAEQLKKLHMKRSQMLRKELFHLMKLENQQAKRSVKRWIAAKRWKALQRQKLEVRSTPAEVHRVYGQDY